MSWLDRGDVDQLLTWLDPTAPPTPGQLLALRGRFRLLARELPVSDRASLAKMGLKIARASDNGDSNWQDPETHRVLSELEEDLGLSGPEAARDLLPAAPRATRELEAIRQPTFNSGQMQGVLAGPHRETRERVLALLADPLFRYNYELPKDEYRDLVLTWLKHLAERGIGGLALANREDS